MTRHPLFAAAAYLLAIAGIVGIVQVASAARTDQAVRVSAQASLDAWATQDYAAFYDTMPPAVHADVTVDEYLDLVTPCPCPPSPTGYLITDVERLSNGRALVHTSQGGRPSQTMEMRHGAGGWYYQPGPSDMAFFDRVGSGELSVREAASLLTAARVSSSCA